MELILIFILILIIWVINKNNPISSNTESSNASIYTSNNDISDFNHKISINSDSGSDSESSAIKSDRIQISH